MEPIRIFPLLKAYHVPQVLVLYTDPVLHNSESDNASLVYS